MTDELYDRITEILDEASTESGALAVPDDDDGADSELLELSEEAADILESTDPRELLEAVGLGTLEDGTEPETVPEAITKGEPEHIEELRRLVRLAKLADREEEGELGTVIDGLREATEEGGQSDAESDEDDEDDGATDDESDEEEDEPEDAESDEDDDATEDGSDDGEDEPEDDEATEDESATDELEDRLRSAMSSSFEEFGDEIASMRDQLEEATLSDDEDEEAADGDEAETEDEDDGLLGSDDDEEDDEDDGLLGSDDDEEDDEDEADDEDDGLLGSDDDDRLGSSESSRHSTMAPPPNERADMNALKRHSTMPKRNR